jgi:predicted type IV restriction endonuclease
MLKTQFKIELGKHIEAMFNDHCDNPKKGEPNTVVKYVVPVLEMLGWDKMADIEFEYKAHNSKKACDIALMLERQKPAVLIEVKPLDDDLREPHVSQLAYYLHTEKVRWGIVTNGREWRFYDKKRFSQKKGQKARTLFRLVLNDYKHLDKKDVSRIADILWVLSRENVTRGFLDAIGDNFLAEFLKGEKQMKKAEFDLSRDELKKYIFCKLIKNRHKILSHKTRHLLRG